MSGHKLDKDYLSRRMEGRFFSKTFPEPNTGCWLWSGKYNPKGYGLGYFDLNGQITTLAHRYSFYLHNGIIDDTLMVLHKCDCSSCVNPDHLYQGNGAQNAYDRDSKGRHVTSPGSRNGNSVLTESQVIEIRSEYSTLKTPQRKLAKKYNVSQFTIKCITKRQTWKHL